MSIRILVADDEPNQLELLTFNLVQADYEVIRAEDGRQALDMIEEHRPDLVIIDWMMPHMSGIDVCRTLRSRAETRQLPIIMLSARGEEGDRTLGRRLAPRVLRSRRVPEGVGRRLEGRRGVDLCWNRSSWKARWQGQ